MHDSSCPVCKSSCWQCNACCRESLPGLLLVLSSSWPPFYMLCRGHACQSSYLHAPLKLR